MGKERQRRQHTVAKTHLSGFADNRTRMTMRRRDGSEQLVALSAATIKTNFYTFYNDAGIRDVSIETWFARDVESPAAVVLRQARGGNAPTATQIPIIARYLAAMLMRTKLTRRRLDEIDSHIGPLVALGEILKQEGLSLARMGAIERARWQRIAAEYWRSSTRDLSPRDRRLGHLRTMLRKIDELAQQLETWHYVVVDVGEDLLITSDSAIAVVEPTPAPGWRGVLPAGAWLGVPVDPRHVIIATSGPNPSSTPKTGSGGAALATVVNNHIAENAYDAIFKHPDSPWPPLPTLAATAQPLPTPTTTFRPSPPGGGPTFLAEYPKVRDPKVAELLEALGADGRV